MRDERAVDCKATRTWRVTGASPEGSRWVRRERSARQDVDTLAASLSGRLLLPGDEGYDDARRVHNGLIDRRPALIVRCRTAADVAAAVRFARGGGHEISVRGGGHNVGGLAVADDAVMIDLAEMRDIQVDPKARTARAEGGVTWAELNAAAGEHELAVTGGAISTTGIAGLTLGGGLGWLMPKFGLAADNVIAIELVTADGEIIEVTHESDPDLFWALRGGGGNFGIATAFTYRVHALGMVTGGLIAHPIDAAPGLLRFYRDAVAGASDDLEVFAGLVHAPDGSGAAALGARGLPHRRPGSGRGGPGPAQGLGLAADGRGRADAVSGHEHHSRRGISTAVR